jgi:hypothetical protein
MTSTGAALFRTVPTGNYLGFWADQRLKVGDVVDFLNLKKADVAKVAGVAQSSVRFDHKIPKEVLARLTEIATVCELVAQYFKGDVSKTALWFGTKNPLLGNVSPRDMIRFGRYEKLSRFILEALEENSPALAATSQLASSSSHEAASATAAHS